MIATPHMLVGAILGDLIDNLPWAFLAGLASHFIFDAIPHLEPANFGKHEKNGSYELSTNQMVFEFFEVAVGAALIIYLFFKFGNPSIITGAVGAILPDVIDNVPFWGPALRKLPGFKQFHQFHQLVHCSLEGKSWIFGLPIYIIVIGIAIWYFGFLRS